MDDKIIEKIQKLFALANSNNENEAKLAAERAQELLLKYNLSAQAIHSKMEDYIENEIKLTKGKRPADSKYLLSIIQTFFFVKPIISHWYDDDKARIKYIFLGKKANVEVAVFTYEFLHRTFYDLWKVYKKEHGISTNGSARNCYFMGLHRGLEQQLSASKVKVEKSVGLVWVGDKMLDQFTHKRFPFLKNSSSQGPRSMDYGAYGKGVEHGKNIRIQKGLGSQASGRGRLLGDGK